MNVDQGVELAITQLEPTTRDHFHQEPLNVLREDLSLRVREAEHLTARSGGGACDGMSFLRDGLILYAPSPNSRRQNFTLAHELGHWLVERATDVFDWVGDQDDAPRVLETLCDRIAQRLLLPDEVIQTVVPAGTPVRASHLLTLYEASQASRPVCAIALATRLAGLGCVAIIDRATARVAYASVQPDPERGWPVVFPWPGQPIPSGHPFNATAPVVSFTKRTFWRDQWDRQDEYYVDVVSDGPRLLAVFSGQDVWQAETLHIEAPRQFDERPLKIVRCCGRTVEVRGWPCSNCGEPDCPTCGLCRCQRDAQREQACRRCFLRYQPHLLVDGLCEDCQ